MKKKKYFHRNNYLGIRSKVRCQSSLEGKLLEMIVVHHYINGITLTSKICGRTYFNLIIIKKVVIIFNVLIIKKYDF